jgi:hypothetical protein
MRRSERRSRCEEGPLFALRRLRWLSPAVCLCFAATATALPSLHLLHHRDDHVHVGDSIVLTGHSSHDDDDDEHDNDDHDHDHDHDEHDHQHRHHDGSGVEHDDDGHPDEPAGRRLPHPDHGRGALAHFGAALVASAIVVWGPPATELATIPPIPAPPRPFVAPFASPRVTRGPPA